MKRVEAIIRPFKLGEVRAALQEEGITGMTAVDVKGCGKEKCPPEIYRGVKYAVDFLPKVMIILYVSDEMVDLVTKAILASAYTGKIGDGKIAILDIETLISIRTGESSSVALLRREKKAGVLT